MGATSEGEAVGLGAGAVLAGRRSVVMCQNSGLGNMVNPLTSLTTPFRLPMLLIVTWRGQPGLKDEPQHDLMGRITHALLSTMGVPWLPFPKDEADIARALDAAEAWMEKEALPFALVMEKGSVDDADLPEDYAGIAVRETRVSPLSGGSSKLPSRYDAVAAVREAVPSDALIIATTGKCGRELFTIDDRPEHLYVVGSMGCASAMGLGVALHTDRPVIVLDGDGAALMKLGNFATVGAYGPPNLTHVVLDNGAHESTGGQPTVSASVDFAGIAAASNYAAAWDVSDLESLATVTATAIEAGGPSMIRARVAVGSPAGLGRPTVAPHEVARRFQREISEGQGAP